MEIANWTTKNSCWWCLTLHRLHFWMNSYDTKEAFLPQSVVNDTVTSFSKKRVYSCPFLQYTFTPAQPLLPFVYLEWYWLSFGALCTHVPQIAAIGKRNAQRQQQARAPRSKSDAVLGIGIKLCWTRADSQRVPGSPLSTSSHTVAIYSV